MPDQCLNLLKTDEERVQSVKEYQAMKQLRDKEGATGFFERKEKEMEDILSHIERVKNHKLAMA